MRIGQNPVKAKTKFPEYKRHRVIIPVYIPVLEGYFAHSLEILELCLRSLFLTTNDEDAVTVISIECHPRVLEFLNKCRESGRIDQLIINKTNHGKIDAILAAARGCYEEFITFADCDAFFYPGWTRATAKLFKVFPEAGWVSPLPTPDHTWVNTSSTIFYAMLKRNLARMRIETQFDLNRFGQSVGRPTMFNDGINTHYLTVNRGETTAIVGGSHFAFTVRKDVFASLKLLPTNQFDKSEERTLGLPFDQLGFWRLSTSDLYVQHMGNTPEPWMFEEMKQLEKTSQPCLVDWNTGKELPKKKVPFGVRVLFSKTLHKLNPTKEKGDKYNLFLLKLLH